MAPPFTPWLGDLIDTELENLIAWKSIVKQEPGSDDEDLPSSSRFEQNDSNFRSVVASPPLDANSKLQLLQVRIHVSIFDRPWLTTSFAVSRSKLSAALASIRWRNDRSSQAERCGMGCV